MKCGDCIHYKTKTQRQTNEGVIADCLYMKLTLPRGADFTTYKAEDSCDNFMKARNRRKTRSGRGLPSFTDEEAIEMKRVIMECQTSLMDLSKKTGISISTINAIRCGNSWRSVEHKGERKKIIRRTVK